MELADLDLLIGFDTEYTAEHPSAQHGETLAFDPDKIIRAGNRVLCISYALYSPTTGQRFSGMVPLDPEAVHGAGARCRPRCGHDYA